MESIQSISTKKKMWIEKNVHAEQTIRSNSTIKLIRRFLTYEIERINDRIWLLINFNDLSALSLPLVIVHLCGIAATIVLQIASIALGLDDWWRSLDYGNTFIC